MKKILCFLAIASWTIPLAAQTDIATFDRYVEQAIRQWEVPGMAVAVVQHGKVLFQKGYGVRKLGEASRVDAQTLYGICSTTKAMTAATVAMLVDEGKLHWDDRVVQHLPEFMLADPFVTRSVRIRDLLTHNAGLPNADFLWAGNELDAAEMIRRLQFLPLAYPLRGGYTYQNVMYLVAGEVVARVSGMPWEAFVQKRLFEPIGMRRTYPTMALSSGEVNRSTPHYRVKGQITPIEDIPVDRVAPAGAVWSCVEDMSKWLLFVLDSARVNGQRLLKPETYAEWLKPQTMVPQNQFYPTTALTKPTWTTYALGWFQHDYQGRTIHFHTGSMAGTIAIAGIMPSADLGVYVLGNLDHAEVRHAIMYKAFDHFGKTGGTRDWSTDFKALYDGIAQQNAQARQRGMAQRVLNSRSSLPVEAYAGNYFHPLYGTIRVSLTESTLHIRLTSQRSLTLEHWHFDTFLGHSNLSWSDTPSTVQFMLGPTGRVTGMRIDQGETLEKVL